MSTYRELYYRWEHEQWEAGAIDFDTDREQWAGLPEDLRSSVLAIVDSGHAAATAALEELIGPIEAAPTEEEQVLLTTRLVDSARHAVFYDLVRAQLTGATDNDLRTESANAPSDLLDAQKRVLSELEAEDVLPGFRAGLTNVIRDEERHLAFAQAFAKGSV